MEPQMSTLFTAEERAILANMPEDDIVELAAELGVTVPGVIRREELMERVIAELARHIRIHGLPLSKWDEEDLRALSPTEVAGLAQLVGVSATVADLMKAGKRAYKAYSKRSVGSPIPLMVPTLLGPLARFASQQTA